MRLLFTLLLAFTFVFAYAQPPVNDDCDGVFDLGVAPACPDTVFFSNINATASDIGFGNSPSCFNGGIADNDVWFEFTTSDTIFDYTITVTGLSDGVEEPLTNPQIALYRGDCMIDGLAELLCVSAEEGETTIELDALGLTPNVPYFIRISDYSATATPNEGTFQICVDELQPVNTIDEMGSTACSGELYDSGGPDGDYQNDENFTFTICPQELTNCINFSLQYYNLGFDNLTFFDGEDTSAPVIGSVGGFGDTEGGGVCFEVQASSGCLTVQFQSDATGTFEGFAGSWQCSALPCEPVDPLVVAGGVTEDEIIDFITTPQTVVSITDIECDDASYGTFTATDQTGLGLERGLLLTSGTLDWAVGPNNDGGGGNFDSDRFAPGDADLDTLSNQAGNFLQSQDACVIELEVFAATNELTFEYVFASEEYPEFVGDGFNDIFAFLISGPGIVGDPNIGNQLNIATLPDGTPVQIDDINNLNNWEYYRSNAGGQTIQYDGLTSDFLGVKKSLTARAQVQPCSTYQLKLAIADRGDGSWDSGVFISELQGGSPDVSIKFNSGIDYLIEDCTTVPDDIIIALNNTLEDTVSYNITISGTAEQGIDYDVVLPPNITFIPGETEFTFPITVLSDMIAEPTETIIITLSNDFGCGEVNLATLEIPLEDVLAVDIEAGQDTAFFCAGDVASLTVEGAANYFWSPVSVFDDPLSENPVASPDSSMVVFVEGTVGLCVDVDSIFLQELDPMVEINPIGPDAICQGDSVTLEVINNTDNQGFSWSTSDLIDDPLATTITVAPEATVDIIANIDLSGCVVSDTLEVIVDPFTFPTLAADTVICENFSVQLATQQPGIVTTTYEWSPATGLSDPTDPEALATPDVTTTYTLIANSASEICADTAEVQVIVTPVDVEIQNPDTSLICRGETIDLVAVTNTGIANGLVWGPVDDPTLSDTLGLSVVASPEVSGQYQAVFTLGDCIVVDSVFVQVDSLPQDLLIMPFDTSVCEGSQVLLTTPIYDPAVFPNIEFEWTPSVGQLTPDSLFNMFISAVDTITYRRLATSGACIDSSFATINAKPIPQVTIDPANASLCVGDPIQLTGTSNVGFDSLTWSPESGLSCIDCLTPIFTPPAAGQINISLEVIKDECPGGASANFEVTPEPMANLAAPLTICPGDAVQLNSLNDGISTYNWTSTDPGFSSTDPLLGVNPTTTTTYYLNASNSCGTLVDSVRIEVFDALQLNVTDDLEICANAVFAINATSVLPPGFSDTYLWEWDGQSSNNPSVTFSDITETTTFRLTYTYDCGTVMDSVIVTVVDPPSISFPAENEICFNDGNFILNLDPNPNYTYQWEAVEDPAFSSMDGAPMVSPITTTTYNVTVTQANCPPLEESFTLNVIEQATVTIEPVDTICAGESVVLTATTTAGDGVAESFSWEINGAVVGTDPSITISENEINETTEVQLLYTYGDNCETVLATTEVIVEEIFSSIELIAIDTTTISRGETVTLELVTEPEEISGLIYNWIPGGQTDQPFLEDLSPTETTTYTVEITTPVRGCLISEEITIEVIEPKYEIPNVFTPNNDGTNDFFNVVAKGNIFIEDFKVYNRWGTLIYDNDNPNEGWDGKVNGDFAPAEVYIYRIVVNDGVNSFVESGDITLLR